MGNDFECLQREALPTLMLERQSCEHQRGDRVQNIGQIGLVSDQVALSHIQAPM